MKTRLISSSFVTLGLVVSACGGSESRDRGGDHTGTDGSVGGAGGSVGGSGGSAGASGGSAGGGTGGMGGGTGGTGGAAGGTGGTSPDGVEPDGGTDPDGGGHEALASGTFVRTLEGSGSSNTAIVSTIGGSRLMFLLHAADIAASGNMTALRLQANTDEDSDITCPNTTIRMGHTNVESLSATFADNVEQGQGSLVTVLDNATVTIPASSEGDFFEIPFETPVHYNGVDHLVFEISRTGDCTAFTGLRQQPDVGYTSFVWSLAGADAEDGTASTARISTAFVFEGGAKNVLAADGGIHHDLFGAPASEGRAQYLLLANDIDGSGPITGIQLEFPSELAAPLSTTYTVTLSRVAPTTTALVDTFSENVGEGPIVVADNLTVTVPAGATEFWLPLTGTFAYDGESNLLIDVTATDITGGTILQGRSVTEGRVALGAGDSDEATTVMRALEPKLRFHGSTVDRVFSAAGFDTYVFTANAAGRSEQYLYHATELGTSGTITRLGCRMTTASSTETEYTNFEVAFAHTDAEALATDMAANMPSPAVAFSGAFTVAAGLIRGDWIEIPLTTGFDYNGLQNLIVQTRTDSGAVEHRCAVIADSDRFASRRAAGATRDATSATTMYDHQRDVRLWMQK
jgi:hypothetical protein